MDWFLENSRAQRWVKINFRNHTIILFRNHVYTFFRVRHLFVAFFPVKNWSGCSYTAQNVKFSCSWGDFFRLCTSTYFGSTFALTLLLCLPHLHKDSEFHRAQSLFDSIPSTHSFSELVPGITKSRVGVESSENQKSGQGYFQRANIRYKEKVSS